MEDNKKINLSKMNELFDNKTLIYRINGFAHACKMDDVKVIENSEMIFNMTNPIYYITTSTVDNDSRGQGITINGCYDDLFFSFTNFYKERKNLNRKIMELPFSIDLVKKIGEDTYELQVETINGMETRFNITKLQEYRDRTISTNTTFYANVREFGSVLKLVKSFVYNPVLVWIIYNEVINKKKIVLTGSDLQKGCMQDERLDKPICKTQKILKKIIG